MSVTITADMSALNAAMDRYSEQVQGSVRPVAQAGAQVLYDEVKRNVASIGKKTGNLANSIYQVFSKDNSGPGLATYHVSWNAHKGKAPHGHLVEFGHIQRYAAYLGKDGQWYTAVRPEMRGKPRPSRRASQAAKDAYYVLLPQAKQVAARPFIRPAASKFPDAVQASVKKLAEIVNGAV